MSLKYPGGFITKSPTNPTSGIARGMWTLNQAVGFSKQGTWPRSPGAPTSITATAGDSSASVAFTAPTDTGSTAITSYTVTSSPGSFTGTGASSPITVNGLTNNTAYTFTVTATNTAGTGPASSASSAVTPLQANYIDDVFNTSLYTGNATSLTVTNNINLSGYGGMVWQKTRDAANQNWIFDTARGAVSPLSSNLTESADQNITGYFGAASLLAPTSSGFNINTAQGGLNSLNSLCVGWSFRKQAKFFDFVTYTGNGGGTRSISHNLGSAPGCMIVKRIDGNSAWYVYHRGAFAPGFSEAQCYMNLNNTNAVTDNAFIWGNTAPTSSVFTVGSQNNTNGATYVIYLFAHDAGGFGSTGSENVISCGSYTGNGSVSNATTEQPGPNINLGWEPQWVMIKSSSSVDTGWFIHDSMRGFSIDKSELLQANSSATESTFGPTYKYIKPTSTGFQITAGTGAYYNETGVKYIYMAIRRPMKVPTVGTSVFKATAFTATNSVATITGVGFPPDLIINGVRSNANYGQQMVDRVRGLNKFIFTNYASSSQSEITNNGTGVMSVNMDGITLGSDTAGSGWNAYSGYTSVKWMFKRATGFFDIAAYTATGGSNSGTYVNYNHNLGVTPELIIVKNRSGAGALGGAGGGHVLHTPTNKEFLYLDSTSASSTPSFILSATSTTFSVRDHPNTGYGGLTYVAYLFASVAGVSKVGSYTGTGALQTINCGFASGARFVLIKRSDSTGAWYTWDSTRGITAGDDPYLLLNTAEAEVSNTNYVDTDSTGFKVTAAAPAALNAAGGTYIFLAIA